MVLPGPAPHTPSRADLQVAKRTSPGLRGSSDPSFHQLMTTCFRLWLQPLLSHGQRRAVLLAECPPGLQWDDVSSQADPALPWLTHELRVCSHVPPGPWFLLTRAPRNPGMVPVLSNSPSLLFCQFFCWSTCLFLLCLGDPKCFADCGPGPGVQLPMGQLVTALTHSSPLHPRSLHRHHSDPSVPACPHGACACLLQRHQIELLAGTCLDNTPGPSKGLGPQFLSPHSLGNAPGPRKGPGPQSLSPHTLAEWVPTALTAPHSPVLWAVLPSPLWLCESRTASVIPRAVLCCAGSHVPHLTDTTEPSSQPALSQGVAV